MENTNNLQETQTEPRLSVMQKLVLIFTSPGKVFQNLSVYPDWIVPAILVLVVSWASAFLINDIQMEFQKEKIINSEKIPDEQKDRIIERMEEGAQSPMRMVWIGVGSTVYIFGSFALVAAIMLFMGNFILGGSANFKSMLAVYSWGFMIAIPEAIIKIPLVLAKNSLHVYTSLAILFDPAESETALFKIADAIDIFALWRVALWSIGFGIIYKFSQQKSVTAVGTLYVIWIALSIILSSVFSGFLG